MEDVRRLIAAGLLAATLSACGGGGGAAPSPYGGGAATEAPKAAPISSPLPTGTMEDPYGYGY